MVVCIIDTNSGMKRWVGKSSYRFILHNTSQADNNILLVPWEVHHHHEVGLLRVTGGRCRASPEAGHLPATPPDGDWKGVECDLISLYHCVLISWHNAGDKLDRSIVSRRCLPGEGEVAQQDGQALVNHTAIQIILKVNLILNIAMVICWYGMCPTFS